MPLPAIGVRLFFGSVAAETKSLEDSANLPEPHLLTAEIADDLRASLEQIEGILADLQARID